MIASDYVLERLVESRLAEVRARGERAQLLASVPRAPSGLAVAVGRVLIQVGRRLVGEPSAAGPVLPPTVVRGRV